MGLSEGSFLSLLPKDYLNFRAKMCEISKKGILQIPFKIVKKIND